MNRSVSSPRLSVAMIARNAEGTIARAIESVLDAADEVVVADTGSEDATREIVKNYPIKSISIPWTDDFSAARNECWSHVGGDWVLWLDAAEWIDSGDVHQLRRLIENHNTSKKAYMLLVQVDPLPHALTGQQIGQFRLVPNRDELRFEGRIRELIFSSLMNSGYHLEGHPSRIRRGTEQHDPGLRVEKAKRDLAIAEDELLEVGPVPRLLNCKGKALQILDHYDDAELSFQRCLNEATPGSAEMLEAYYGLLAVYDLRDPTTDAQVTLCLEAIDRYPLDAQLLLAMGGYMQAKEQWDLACRSYQTAYQHGQVNPLTWHLTDTHEIGAVCYSLALQMQNNDMMAEKALQEALQSHPNSVRLRRQLLELLVKLGRADDALVAAKKMPWEASRRQSMISAIRGACLASQRNWPAAKPYLQAAYAAGCRDPIVLRSYVLTLRSTGEEDKSRAVLLDWKDLQPNNPEIRCLLDPTAENKTPNQPHAPMVGGFQDNWFQTGIAPSTPR